MMPRMGTTAPQEIPESAAPSEEGGVRAAIVEAARRVAQREGVAEMTLTDVAREAHAAASDIYAFFTSKNDLLQAVVADDLAALAKTMRRSLEHPSGASETELPVADAIPVALAANEPAVAASACAVENSELHDTQGQPMQATEPLPNEKPEAPEPAAPSSVQETPRRFPVVQPLREAPRSAVADANATTAGAIARLEDAVAKLQATPVDQWLERRLREFERTLYALQHNQNHRASPNTFEQGLQTLRESLDAIEMRHTMAADEAARATGERFDTVDKRLREMLSELQAESVHLAKRITALENLAFASRPDQMPPPVEAFAAAEAPESGAGQAQESGETHDPANEPVTQNGDETVPSYLMAARRSAQAAAQQASEDLRGRAIATRPKKILLLAACGALLVLTVLLAGVGIMLRNSSMNGDTVPARNAAPVHLAPAAAKPLRHRASQRAIPKAPQANLRELAQTGNASAELLVGLEYLEGKGVAKNEAMAVDWLSRAAAKGQPVAQYDLGALYADGRGVHADPVQAFQWFGSAALRGNRRAMHFLAIAYAEGVGTTKNLGEAARWFERAANLGAVNSQFNIAVLYERGLGVPQSLTTAYTWYAIAARQGDHESQARVTALASTLKPEDLANAKAAADAFRPQPLDPAANLPPKLPL